MDKNFYQDGKFIRRIRFRGKTMNKYEIEESKLISDELSILALRKAKGFANVCPKCKNIGQFGSVSQLTVPSGEVYYCCGWCMRATLKEEE